MSPKINELVWVRRNFGARLKLVSARVVEINPSAVLPYRLRFADGTVLPFNGSELVDPKETR